jgi:hypothetical protein
MVRREGIVAKFEEWVKKNFRGRPMLGPPDDWDRSKELYYKMGNLYYGPIMYEKIPTHLR